MAEQNLNFDGNGAMEAELPLYQGVALADVVLVVSAAQAAEARTALLAGKVIGFDTESKPTFAKGEVSTGPHLIQLAIAGRVYLYPVAQLVDLPGLKAILESPSILKVGFGLESDLAQLRSRLSIETRNVLDLSRVLKSETRNHSLGAKTAVARFFGQRLQKSKRTTTSNWANPRLTERQMLYAANDAQVALRVYDAALAADLLPAPRAKARAVADDASRDLLRRHAPLVRQIAQGMAKGLPASVQVDDLMQDGQIGLLDAVIRSTRETSGRQFEKYAAQRMRGAMLDGLRANDGGTRRVRREMRRVEAAIQALAHRLGRAPGEGEVARALEMPIADYQKLLQEADGYFLVSLEDLTGAGDWGEHAEALVSSEHDPLVVLERASFRRALVDALHALPEAEQVVMALYYEEARTMRKIGEALGVSEGRVSQIHAQAIARLRAAVFGADELLLRPRRQAR